MRRYTPTQRQLDAWVANILFQLATQEHRELFYVDEPFDLHTALVRALPDVATAMTKAAPDPYVAACVLIDELSKKGHIDENSSEYFRNEVHLDTRQAQRLKLWTSMRFKNVWSSRRTECFFGSRHEVQMCANCRTLRCMSCATTPRCTCCQRPFQPSYR